MKRRLIVIAVAVAVIGALGFWTYDRYLGRELRQGEALRDALAAELASNGVAFTSMEYDWRARRVVAEGLVATELPEGVTALSVGRAIYRGADPATIRAALAETETGGDSRRAELIQDLTLSDVLIGFDGGAEFKQGSLSLKHLGLDKPVPRDGVSAANSGLAQAVEMARRLHVRLLEAKDARFWHPKAQATYEQKLLRLEDYRAGNFSEFRLEGMSLVVAVVVRATLDEYFVESVKARRFLDNLHRTPFFALPSEIASAFGEIKEEIQGEGGASGGDGDEEPAAPKTFPPAAETALIYGDSAAIGFEALIPAAGRIAFEEISTTDRQFLNGVEVGGKSKSIALELQFNMLTQMLTAGLDAMGINLAAAAASTGSEAQAWLASRAGNAAGDDGPVAASLQTSGQEKAGEGKKPDAGSDRKRIAPPDPGKGGKDQIPMGPRDGEVEQGPGAPVPEVWGNRIEPPPAVPEMDNRELAEIIRKLGFDDLRIDSEWISGFDERAKVWEIPKSSLNIRNFWNMTFDLRLSGMGALEDLGHVPVNASGWFAGPKADAVGERFLKEGRFEGLSFTYREQGFLSRLLAVIAEKQNTTVEALASEAIAELFSEEGGGPGLQAEGLAEAIKAFLIAPEVFSVRFQPGEPVRFSEFPAMNEQKWSVSQIASRLGLVLTFNQESFTGFKKSTLNRSDIEDQQD